MWCLRLQNFILLHCANRFQCQECSEKLTPLKRVTDLASLSVQYLHVNLVCPQFFLALLPLAVRKWSCVLLQQWLNGAHTLQITEPSVLISPETPSPEWNVWVTVQWRACLLFWAWLMTGGLGVLFEIFVSFFIYFPTV